MGKKWGRHLQKNQASLNCTLYYSELDLIFRVSSSFVWSHFGPMLWNPKKQLNLLIVAIPFVWVFCWVGSGRIPCPPHASHLRWHFWSDETWTEGNVFFGLVGLLEGCLVEVSREYSRNPTPTHLSGGSWASGRLTSTCSRPFHLFAIFAHVSFVVFLLRFPVSPKGVAPK